MAAPTLANYTRLALQSSAGYPAESLVRAQQDYADNVQVNFCLALIRGATMRSALENAMDRERVIGLIGDRLDRVDIRIIDMVQRTLPECIMNVVLWLVTAETIEWIGASIMNFISTEYRERVEAEPRVKQEIVEIALRAGEEWKAHRIETLRGNPSAFNPNAMKINAATNPFAVGPARMPFIADARMVSGDPDPAPMLAQFNNARCAINLGHYSRDYPMGHLNLCVRLPADWDSLPEDVQRALITSNAQSFELFIQEHDMDGVRNDEGPRNPNAREPTERDREIIPYNPQHHINVVPHHWMFADCPLDDPRTGRPTNLIREAQIGAFHLEGLATDLPHAIAVNGLRTERPWFHDYALSSNICRLRMTDEVASFISVVVYNGVAKVTVHKLRNGMTPAIGAAPALNAVPDETFAPLVGIR
ncbi:MAG: hypothetical protein SP1CHLAM54_03050 [Chlamydiia bacterium]|nr:hypothetical protein [Chlamydiia bacterium]MCH9615221.1 hypothetical protein [Chlamydiia bacterium]MCH9628457.1 hypothetical protein [Chlamydiia bacterium]